MNDRSSAIPDRPSETGSAATSDLSGTLLDGSRPYDSPVPNDTIVLDHDSVLDRRSVPDGGSVADGGSVPDHSAVGDHGAVPHDAAALNDDLVLRMFAVSLELHTALPRIHDALAAERVVHALGGLDEAINDLRCTAFGLRHRR